MIDHLVYGVPELGAGIDDLERRLGVRATYGGSHRGRGTHNALLGLGGRTYLEIIAPDPAQAADEHPAGLPFGVHADISPQLVGWALAAPDVDSVVARARAAGYDPGDAAPMQRETADKTLLEWRLTGDAFPLPFLIDWGGSPHPAATAPAGATLTALTLVDPSPERVRDQLAVLRADDVVTVAAGADTRLTAEVAGPAGVVTL